MLQGTASSVGKSTLVAGLCRLFSRSGVRVAPFKAQNMSNNAAVCADGGEIGRAQYAQAMAAGVAPTVDMNPVLLKPQRGTSQLIVRGHLRRSVTAADYFGGGSLDVWPEVVAAFDRLRDAYELVIIEGAGSPAEINLRSRDIVNMRVALHAQAEVLLVADIDHGGAFASLLGTWSFLEPAERALLRGFILNKFRGDPGLLEPAPSLLRDRTGVPVVGVVPFLDDLLLPEEDAASLPQHTTPPSPSQPATPASLSQPATPSSVSERATRAAQVEIAVIRLPHISNFDEFTPLAHEPSVHLRYVASPEELRAPDLVILPGTKATIPDLLWLRERGLAERIRWLAQHETPVLGVCGGYQLLGRTVTDPHALESSVTCADGLGLLPIQTELQPSKHLRRVHGSICPGLPGIWSNLAAASFEGYEIHNGTSTGNARPFAEVNDRPDIDGRPEVDDRADGHDCQDSAGRRAGHLRPQDCGWPDGAVSADGTVASTYVHGVLEAAPPRHALLAALAARRGFTWQPSRSGSDADPYQFDRLADVLAASLDPRVLKRPR